jgi:NADPH:quinone reductase-like Zn-dependent oxidoreductase
VAKALGAQVTAVCSGRNAALATELGADRVVDYTAAKDLGAALRSAVEAAGRPFDLCFDTVTSSEVWP